MTVRELRASAPAAARPLVSVVIPSYNHARFVGEAIESVAQQGYDLTIGVGRDAGRGVGPGIVRDLSGSLAERGVSIEELHTEIVSGAMSAEHLFKVKALLLVPKSVSNDALRRGLEALANEMMVDIALGEDAAAAKRD